MATVIGGSGAIGSAICRHFAEAGATCIVTYNRGKEAAKDLLLSLPGQGHWAANVPVEDGSALSILAADIEAKHGRLDVLVNCAGIT
ncbi:MAG: SDR family NAD(P)-dependent oxidoreductase, partial [Burkholderiales bacterium]